MISIRRPGRSEALGVGLGNVQILRLATLAQDDRPLRPAIHGFCQLAGLLMLPA